MLPRFFDTDQHITEPPDFWLKQVPSRLREIAPQVVHSDKTGDAWSFDAGALIRPIGLVTVGSEDPRKIGPVKSYGEVDPASWDAKLRVEALDIDGVETALVFPSIGALCSAYKEDELYRTFLQMYNDGVWEWSQEGGSHRLMPVAQVPAIGVEQAMAELKRVAEKGFRAYMFNQWPSSETYPSVADEPFWSLLEETGMVLCLHGTGPARVRGQVATRGVQDGRTNTRAAMGRTQEMIAAGRGAGLGVPVPLAAFVMGGILERHPKLKVALIETSAGWLPSFTEQLDRLYLQQRWALGYDRLSRMPSEYIKEIKLNFDREWVGVKYREFIGVENLMYGSDYPHIGSFYPHSRFYTELVMRDVPRDEQAKIFWGNAAAFFGI